MHFNYGAVTAGFLNFAFTFQYTLNLTVTYDRDLQNCPRQGQGEPQATYPFRSTVISCESYCLGTHKQTGPSALPGPLKLSVISPFAEVYKLSMLFLFRIVSGRISN